MSSADDRNSSDSAAPNSTWDALVKAKEVVCFNCHYWDQDDEDPVSGTGICRRYPPSISNKRMSIDANYGAMYPAWPMTEENEWCGEHKPKENDSHE
jgi:hypothetical protein